MVNPLNTDSRAIQDPSPQGESLRTIKFNSGPPYISMYSDSQKEIMELRRKTVEAVCITVGVIAGIMIVANLVFRKK